MNEGCFVDFLATMVKDEVAVVFPRGLPMIETYSCFWTRFMGACES